MNKNKTLPLPTNILQEKTENLFLMTKKRFEMLEDRVKALEARVPKPPKKYTRGGLPIKPDPMLAKEAEFKSSMQEEVLSHWEPSENSSHSCLVSSETPTVNFQAIKHLQVPTNGGDGFDYP